MRCIRQGVQEIIDGKTEGDEDYEWFGGVAKKHAFKLIEGKTYSKADENIICYNPL